MKARSLQPPVRAFAIAGLVAVMVVVLGVVAVAVTALANRTVALSRAVIAASEHVSQIRRTNDLAAVSILDAIEAELDDYVAGSMASDPTFREDRPDSELNSVNPTQGPAATRSRSRLLTSMPGSSPAYELIPTPPGARTVFGNQPSFVGRRLLGHFDEVLGLVDPIGNLATGSADRRRVSVYEFPANAFAASGRHVELGAEGVAGSVLGEHLSVFTGATVAGSMVVGRSMVVGEGATVGGRSLSRMEATVSAHLAKELEFGKHGAPTGSRVAIFPPAEEDKLIILSDPTPDAEGIPQDFRLVSDRLIRPLEIWALPAFQCATRVRATLQATSSPSVRVEISRRQEPVIRWSEEVPVDEFVLASSGGAVRGISLEHHGSDLEHVLVITPEILVAEGVATKTASIYVEFRTSDGRIVGDGRHAVALRPVSAELSGLDALSLVTPNRLHIDGSTNVFGKPASIFAPEVRFGLVGSPGHVVMSGQRGIYNSAPSAGIGDVRGSDGTILRPDQRTVSLSDLTDPTDVPPVNLRGLLIHVRDLY